MSNDSDKSISLFCSNSTSKYSFPSLGFNEDLESNYFDLEFEDGYVLEAVSGYELDFIDNESLNEEKSSVELLFKSV